MFVSVVVYYPTHGSLLVLNIQILLLRYLWNSIALCIEYIAGKIFVHSQKMGLEIAVFFMVEIECCSLN